MTTGMINISDLVSATDSMAQEAKRQAIIAELETVDDAGFQVAVRMLASKSGNALTGKAWDRAAAGLLYLKKQHEQGAI